MFVGQFQFTLDAKKRLVIPSKFRNFFPQQETEIGVYVSVNRIEYNNTLSNYLEIYPEAAWKEHTDWMSKAAQEKEEVRLYMRKLASDTEFCKVDAQWRIVVPLRLITSADLKRDIMITGAINRIEVWEMEKWKGLSGWLKEHSTDFEKSIYRSS
jgi:MraZ protein